MITQTSYPYYAITFAKLMELIQDKATFITE